MKIFRGQLTEAILSDSKIGVHSQSKYYSEIKVGENVLTDILIDNLDLQAEIELCLGKNVEIFIAPYKPYHTKLELILIRLIGD